jgi:hypothetical protein
MKSTLGELRAATRSAATVLFTLDSTSVAREQVFLAENRLAFRIVFLERARNSELAGVGLTSCSAAVDVDDDVYSLAHFGLDEGGENGIAKLSGAKEFFEFSIVNADAPLTRTDANARDGGLTSTSSKFVVLAVAFDNVITTFNHSLIYPFTKLVFAIHFFGSSSASGC